MPDGMRVKGKDMAERLATEGRAEWNNGER